MVFIVYMRTHNSNSSEDEVSVVDIPEHLSEKLIYLINQRERTNLTLAMLCPVVTSKDPRHVIYVRARKDFGGYEKKIESFIKNYPKFTAPVSNTSKLKAGDQFSSP